MAFGSNLRNLHYAVLVVSLANSVYSGTSRARAAGTQLSISVASSEETVFNWKTERCDDADIPDDAARAFRDSSNTVHLIASHLNNRAMTGSDLDHVVKNCHIIFRAGQSDDPMTFDSEGWIESVYTEDGVNIHALISMDYHPERYNLPCFNEKKAGDCWYSTIVAAQSHDKGENFSIPAKLPQRFVSGSALSFDPRRVAVVGSLVPSNILKVQSFYYVLFSVAGYGDQVAGECIMRTMSLDDARSWRSWDGTGFNVEFLPPAANRAVQKPNNVCTTLKDLQHAPVRSVSKIGSRYIAISFDSGDPGSNIKSKIVAQTSFDLIHWSSETTVMVLPIYGADRINGTAAYFYPSLLDPKSSSRNFDDIGAHPYLYMTKYTYGAGLDRNLVRYRLNIGEPSE